MKLISTLLPSSSSITVAAPGALMPGSSRLSPIVQAARSNDDLRQLPVLARKPQDNDALLAGWLVQSGTCLTAPGEGPLLFNLGYYIGSFDGLRYHVVPAATPADIKKALDVTERAAAPGDKALILTALTKLSVLTRRKAEDQDDIKLRLAAYMEKLALYPADVVVATLAAWPDKSPWWPAWQELNETMAKSFRVHVHRGLTNALQKRTTREAQSRASATLTGDNNE